MSEQESKVFSSLHANPLMDRLSYLATDIESEVGTDAADEFRAWLDRWGGHEPSDEDEGIGELEAQDPSDGDLRATFSLDVVREVLREAVEEEDQVSALWAAYLFSFDRRRVVEAWDTADVVVLGFASAELRESALAEYRMMTGEE